MNARSPSPEVAESATPAALSRFLARFDALCEALNKPSGPVSRALFGDSDRVGAIRATNSDIGVKRLHQAEADLQRMADEAGVTLPLAVEPPESEPSEARSLQAGAA